MFARNTYRAKEAVSQSCATCQFAGVVEHDRAASTTHCHRRPPLMRANEREWRFPQVEPSSRCSEWTARVDEPRDEAGAPERLRCALCKHASPGAHECRLKAPAHISHAGGGIHPEVGQGHWCGEAEVEAGVESEVFAGVLPAVVLALRDRRKAG